MLLTPRASRPMHIVRVAHRISFSSYRSPYPDPYSQVSKHLTKDVIVAGYPIIYHHLKSLSEIESVRHVFLVGKHDPKKFSHFIDECLTEFSFKTIQFISDEIPKNEAGVLFKYRQQLLEDDPSYLMVMRYKMCSSFPLKEIIEYHK